MTSNTYKMQLDDNYHSETSLYRVERRERQRRANSDRREIERFGFEIVSRRSGSDRRVNEDVSQKHN
jgi:hypothetical protein